MDYQVMESRFNFNPDNADILFATNDRQEAIEAAKEFGAGTVVVKVKKRGKSREYLPPLTIQIWGLKNKIEIELIHAETQGKAKSFSSCDNIKNCAIT